MGTEADYVAPAPKPWTDKYPVLAASVGIAILVGTAYGIWNAVAWFNAPPAFPSIGQQAIVPPNVLLCPDTSSITLFFESLAKADAANDAVGKMDALRTAISMGCYSSPQPISAKIIDTAGFSPQLARLRLPDTSAAWASADELNPQASTPSQPN